MNINDVTVSWQDISDTERTALLNKPCPPRAKPKVLPPRKTPDRITSRVFSICQSAVLNNHAVQRSVRLNNLKSHTASTSSKENVDNAYRTMIEFTETCKRESHNDSNPIEMPLPKRIRSSSPTSNIEQCSSPSAISRYTSHDSYLTYIPPQPTSPSSSSSEQRLNVNNTSHIEIDLVDDALWDDWDLPSTVNKKTPGKIRTMSSPAVHSRTKHIPETTTIVEIAPTDIVAQAPKEPTPVPTPTTGTIVWDDDDDFEQLLSQFPGDVPCEKALVDDNSLLLTTPTMDEDENTTRLDATRRSSAMLTQENQSFLHNTTRIELSSQPQLTTDRPSTTSLQRASTGPLSPMVKKTVLSSQVARSPRVRCDSSSTLPPKKVPCTEAEIEQKRLAALAKRRLREEEEQRRKQMA